MAGTNPEVEIIVACAYGDIGQRLRPNGTVRDWLIGQGYAKVIEVEARPGKLAGKALGKIGNATKKLFNP